VYILGALFLLFAAKIMELIKQLLMIPATRRTIDRSPQILRYFMSSEVIIQYLMICGIRTVLLLPTAVFTKVSIKEGVPVAGTGCLAWISTCSKQP